MYSSDRAPARSPAALKLLRNTAKVKSLVSATDLEKFIFFLNLILLLFHPTLTAATLSTTTAVKNQSTSYTAFMTLQLVH